GGTGRAVHAVLPTQRDCLKVNGRANHETGDETLIHFRADARQMHDSDRPVDPGGPAAVLGVFATGVGGPNDLSHAQATPGDEGALGVRPVVAAEVTCIHAQTRSAAELAYGHDENLAIQAAVVNVF